MAHERTESMTTQMEHRAQDLVTLESAETVKDLENRFALAVRQRDLLEGYIRERLKPDKHFYKVGNSEKPSLTKEGAELVCLPHGLKPMYFPVSGPDDPPAQPAPYQMTVRCRLMRGDVFGGEGLGSASSFITTRSGEYKPRQTDPGLCHNATLKMAQKSAYIAATLNATAASEFFTQDVEDAQASGGEQPKPPQGDLCPVHNVRFFQSGKMREPAHKLDDGSWCNKSKVVVKVVERPAPPTPIRAEAPDSGLGQEDQFTAPAQPRVDHWAALEPEARTALRERNITTLQAATILGGPLDWWLAQDKLRTPAEAMRLILEAKAKQAAGG